MQTTYLYYNPIAKDPFAKLRDVIKARARHHYCLPIKVRKGRKAVVLSATDPRTGEVVSEMFPQDRIDLQLMYMDGQAFYEHADRIIQRFWFPVRAIECV